MDSVRTTDGASLQILATHTQHCDLNDVYSLHGVIALFSFLVLKLFNKININLIENVHFVN